MLCVSRVVPNKSGETERLPAPMRGAHFGSGIFGRVNDAFRPKIRLAHIPLLRVGAVFASPDRAGRRSFFVVHLVDFRLPTSPSLDVSLHVFAAPPKPPVSPRPADPTVHPFHFSFLLPPLITIFRRFARLGWCFAAPHFSPSLNSASFTSFPVMSSGLQWRAAEPTKQTLLSVRLRPFFLSPSSSPARMSSVTPVAALLYHPLTLLAVPCRPVGGGKRQLLRPVPHVLRGTHRWLPVVHCSPSISSLFRRFGSQLVFCSRSPSS